MLVRELLQGVVVPRARPHGQRRDGVHRDEATHRVEVVGRLEDARLERRLALQRSRAGLRLRGVGEQVVEGVVGLDQRPRGLLADAAHAGKVVRRVAAQDRELRVSRSAGTPYFARTPASSYSASSETPRMREQQLHDGIADELDQVAVARDDLDPVGLVRFDAERADRVLGLPSLGLGLQQSREVEHAPEERELLS